MLLKLMAATESDADRIADIHMAVFGTNLLLFAQFPTRAIRDQLRDCIAQKAAHDIRDPNIAVKVVRDQDQVISFAKWSLPVAASETHVEAPWIWPEGSNLLVLDEWTEKAELAKQRILGDTPSYRLSFIGTDLQHERRGAATSLIQWGLDKCTRDNIPAYLDSTFNAGPLYEKLGFRAAERLSIVLEGLVTYEEVCYLLRPSNTSCPTEASATR